MTSPSKAELERWLACLRATYEERDEELKDRFQRSLPFQDAMFDRWERARSLGFGDGASIYHSAQVFGQVMVGEGTWIGPYVVLDGQGATLSIGATCSISSGVHIYTHNTIRWALSGGQKEAQCAPVKIGNRSYIGSQTVISAGVTIGEGCVIAANSFVNREVKDSHIVGGSPAKVIGKVRFEGDEPILDFNERAFTPENR